MNEAIDRHLQNKIIPFWNRQVDKQHGGFYGFAEVDLIPNQFGDKGSIKMARLLWAYSALYRHYQDKSYLKHAQIAYDYLMKYLYDKDQQGVYWKSSYSGQIINDTKHVYAQSFAIYGFSEYYLASHNNKALECACDLFQTIEEKAYCQEKNSYHEQFTRNWIPVENTLLASNTIQPAYTTNTLIHLIEAYTSLYCSSKRQDVRERIIGLLQLFVDRAFDRSRRACFTEYDVSWRPIDTKTSFGHDIETSWLIDRAMDVIQFHPVQLTEMTAALCENTLKNGYFEGVIDSGRSEEKPGETLVWWVQAEAVIGFLNHFQKTNEKVYLEAARRTLDVTMTKIVDHRDGGEWFWSVDQTGKPLEDYGISENWKANYHNVRMCLEILKRGEML
ncbi:MAG: AGE family epimerase/isomerase [Candidatus Izemoplasmatales bacterium]|jgi:mannobiose 2-epimerase